MWFIIGIVLGALLLGLIMYLRSKSISLTWYEWVIGLMGLLLLLFTLQSFRGSFAELEPYAAYIFLLVTGLPSIILLAIAWQLSVRRIRKA
ncbi:MAG: dehalogenase [Dehalococcoides mccartyi]|uniref:dehalogenase n=1 Tax=Dehalococcoides mccartyi TaxID=61435 RepID=UPI000804DFDD|nr:dehalogenase [Dehalococcoides mccartyi]OBW62540.1 MAG: dehalogenase [Dehalococcoides mccartyi]